MARFDLTGKVALVTGGAEGIGQELSTTLAEQGADIAIFDIKEELMKKTVEQVTRDTGKKVKGWHCDVTDEDAVIRCVGEVVKEYGKIDILVNNAGILNYGSIDEYTTEQWHLAIDTDLMGPWLVTREVVVQSMRENHYGRVINISSIAGLLGSGAGCISYNAAKGGVLGLTRGQAVEYAPYGVLVNSVGPGTILSGGMTSRSKIASDPETHTKGRCPLKRAGNWGELSGAVIYFASDECTFTTGQALMVDGGISITLN